MYKLAVEIKVSQIEGKGVFCLENIPKGMTVWQFIDGHDILMPVEEFENLADTIKDSIGRTGYLSPWSNMWVFPPDGDPAQYTNHSSNNNLSVVYDSSVSSEPYFVANRDIHIGDELTNNYHEFDAITRATQPVWAVQSSASEANSHNSP